MRLTTAFSLLLGVPATLVAATTYFKETFDDDTWKTRWLQSSSRPDYGKFAISTGTFFADPVASRALQTQDDARNYAMSAPFTKDFDNTNSTFVLQYSVKFERGSNCAGGYVKILPPGVDVARLNGETPYNIMFGPDICGPDQKVHFIMNYDKENRMIQGEIPPPIDQLSHLYTLIIHPNQTYAILIDNEVDAEGSLFDDFNFFPPKTIPDPKVSKPADWDDREMIDDEADEMPDDWEDEPEEIPDPEDPPPKYWNEDVDGEWFRAMVPNPLWKGEWTPRQIPNPKYKGAWVHPEIDNPKYFYHQNVHAYKSAYVAFELWQVTAGSLFDDILVTDSVEEARAMAAAFVARRVPEYEAKEKLEDEDRARVRREKEAKEKEKAAKGHSEL
ncbi:Calreticulin/calnexin [Geranomyces variabilis]|nr:Calreticulin/calnexin [Geranomyces variabilis]KAJ3141191.1 hypothetical protein HDU90_007217 [Geranomyces variabilis]